MGEMLVILYYCYDKRNHGKLFPSFSSLSHLANFVHRPSAFNANGKSVPWRNFSQQAAISHMVVFVFSKLGTTYVNNKLSMCDIVTVIVTVTDNYVIVWIKRAYEHEQDAGKTPGRVYTNTH